MSTEYFAVPVIPITTQRVHQICPMQYRILTLALQDFDFGLHEMAEWVCSGDGAFYDLSDEEVDRITHAYEMLEEEFKRKTGIHLDMEMVYDIANPYDFDGENWTFCLDFDSIFKLTKEAEMFERENAGLYLKSLISYS